MAILYYLLYLAGFLHLVSGLVTLLSINEITNLTKDCTADIVRSAHIDTNSVLDWTQVVLNNEDDDEVEDTVAAALRVVNSEILAILNKPLNTKVKSPTSFPSCDLIVSDYHAFLSASALFLRALQDKQQIHRWPNQSPVFHALAWLQSLWASRKTNEQNRSFIEQQIMLYSATACFGSSNEVLRRDVELVEYMNDLLDTFE